MPDGVAPGAPANGEPGSSVRMPPLTEKPATVLCAASTTQSVEPSGESRASSAPCRPVQNGVEPEQRQRAVAAIE